MRLRDKIDKYGNLNYYLEKEKLEQDKLTNNPKILRSRDDE
jgi:hypothetical protein